MSPHEHKKHRHSPTTSGDKPKKSRHSRSTNAIGKRSKPKPVQLNLLRIFLGTLVAVLILLGGVVYYERYCRYNELGISDLGIIPLMSMAYSQAESDVMEEEKPQPIPRAMPLTDHQAAMFIGVAFLVGLVLIMVLTVHRQQELQETRRYDTVASWISVCVIVVGVIYFLSPKKKIAPSVAPSSSAAGTTKIPKSVKVFLGALVLTGAVMMNVLYRQWQAYHHRLNATHHHHDEAGASKKPTSKGSNESVKVL